MSVNFFNNTPSGTGLPGAAATIEVGSVTTVEPNEPADVKNVGTVTAAKLDFYIPRGRDITARGLFDFSVAQGFGGTWEDWLREYLARQTDLLRCSGHFSDRSLSNNVWTTVTPTVDSGDFSIVSGNRIIFPNKGLYAVTVGGGISVQMPTSLTCSILLNQDIWIQDYWASLKASNTVTNNNRLPTASGLWEFQVGDYISIILNASPTTSSFIAFGSRFTFDIFQLR